MPTYIYETISQDARAVKRYEIDQRMSAAPLSTHPETGERIQRVITGGLGFIGAKARGTQAQPPAGGCGSGSCGHSHH